MKGQLTRVVDYENMKVTITAENKEDFKVLEKLVDMWDQQFTPITSNKVLK